MQQIIYFWCWSAVWGWYLVFNIRISIDDLRYQIIMIDLKFSFDIYYYFNFLRFDVSLKMSLHFFLFKQ